MYNRIKVFRITAVLSVLFSLIFFGCSAPQEEAGEEPVILHVGLRKLTTIDPALGANDPEIMFNQLQYDYLIDILPSGDLAPSLAAEWDISSDGLVYTFRLRENVLFEDGSPFTADDVVFTFNRLVTSGSSIVGLLGQKIVGEDDEGTPVFEPTWTVEAVEENTARFILEQANADFLFGVASRFAMILHDGTEKVNVISSGDDPYENFNGTGPFVLMDYRADERAVFKANENYWMDDAPKLDGIELVFFDDNQSQLDALQSGTLDFIIKIPQDLADSLERIPSIQILNQATNTHPVIRLLTDEGSIGEDVRLRQALKYATDRELINTDVLDGAGTVGNNDPIGPTYGILYNPQNNQEYNPSRAKELIAEVFEEGKGNGFIREVNGEPRVQVPFYVGDTFEYGLVAEFLQQQWAEGGIDVELNVIPESVYYADNENNWLNTQLGMTAWGSRATPQEYLSVAYTTGALYNEARWSNSDLDALALQASQIADLEERSKVYDRISRIFLEEGPVLIPYFRPVIGAHANKVKGIRMHSFPGRTDFRQVSIEN